ncbi:unnamed protein product, partial [Brachionus calyciflorus]
KTSEKDDLDVATTELAPVEPLYQSLEQEPLELLDLIPVQSIELVKATNSEPTT